MKSLKWMISYFMVALLGLWLAFAVSLKLMTPAHSQDAPTNAEIPPEFLDEVEKTQVPSATPTGAPTPPAAGQQGRPDVAPQPPSGDSTIPAPPTELAAPEADPAGAVEPTVGQPNVQSGNPNLLVTDEYFYDPTGKRDPFKPVGLKALGLSKPVVLEPLQRFELEKLQVVGILWDVNSPRAMVRDPDGIMHTVIKNSKMGRSEGFVAAIREGEVVVVETLYEDGKTLNQTRVLELKK